MSKGSEPGVGGLTKYVDTESLRRAIERMDGAALETLYTDAATICVLDGNTPHSKSHHVSGRLAIRVYWERLFSDMTDIEVPVCIAEGEYIAYQLNGRRKDRSRVYSMSLIGLDRGLIEAETVVRAGDKPAEVNAPHMVAVHSSNQSGP